jgi:uncharacterized membrane protein
MVEEGTRKTIMALLRLLALVQLAILLVPFGWIFFFGSGLPDEVPVRASLSTPSQFQAWSLPVLLVPAVANVVLFLLLRWCGRLDRQAGLVGTVKEWERHQVALALARLLVTGYGLLVFVLVVGFVRDNGLDVARWGGLGFVLLLCGVALLLPRFLPGATFGIRTPWTVDDEEVWRRTHRISAGMWLASGLVLVAIWSLSAFWSRPFFLGTLVVAVLLVLFSVALSAYLAGLERERRG